VDGRYEVGDAIHLDRSAERLQHRRIRLVHRYRPLEVRHPGSDDGREPPPTPNYHDFVTTLGVPA
jgi:hypothetical protein